MDANALLQNLAAQASNFGVRLITALIFWFIGGWLIRIVVALFTRAFDRKELDPTLIKYLASALTLMLKVVLVVSILGHLGFETTSFAALLAAIGIAIGAAWGGLLANLAAGVFLIFLRPFKVGDFVQAGGIVGTVREITLFATALDTPDNVRSFVGNNKILSDNIQNFCTNQHRRVDLVAQLSHGTDHAAAIRMLQTRLAQIPNVIATPGPEVSILSFTNYGPVLAVRSYCHNDHYWQVYFDGNKLIREAFGEAKFSVPEQHVLVRNLA